jgi:hypothetical protein
LIANVGVVVAEVDVVETLLEILLDDVVLETLLLGALVLMAPQVLPNSARSLKESAYEPAATPYLAPTTDAIE